MCLLTITRVCVCVLQYDHLQKMVRDFQPFFDLWTTASNWLNWHEKWLNDPLTSIDPEQLERNVSEAHKTMHKCFKQFKELPGKWRAHLRLNLPKCHP